MNQQTNPIPMAPELAPAGEEANRYNRINAAQNYHSPVEERLRQFDERVAEMQADKPEALESQLSKHMKPNGMIEIVPPPPPMPSLEGDAQQPGEPQDPSMQQNPQQPEQQPAQPFFPPQQNGAPDAPAEPALPSRYSLEREGTNYIFEDREDGTYVIAKQAEAFAEPRVYDGGIKVERTMLMDPEERSFMDRVANTASTIGDVNVSALRGVSFGLTKLITNATRTLADNPVGEAVFGAEEVAAYDKAAADFIKRLDKAAAKLPQTEAGQIATSVGEIAGQFVVPGVKVYKALRAAGASPIVASLLAEVGVAIFGVTPEDENLASMIPEDSESFKAVRELLATDPNGDQWENRAKNAVEAFAMMGVGEAVGRGIIKSMQRIQQMSKDMPARAVELMDKLVENSGQLLRDETGSLGRAQVTKTPEFKNWFGDSKVVDDDGAPLVVYHGTQATFNDDFAFDVGRIGQNASAEGYGFYFTSDESTARGYVGRDTGDVGPFYLNIEKPLPVDAPVFSVPEAEQIVASVIKREIASSGGEIADYRDSFISNFLDTYSTDERQAIREVAEILVDGNDTAVDLISEIANVSGGKEDTLRGVIEATGYDGVFSNGYGNTGEEGGKIYVAFLPEQIKSVNNRGTFDPADPRIQFGIAGAGAAATLSPEEAEASARTDVLQKAIRLINEPADLQAGRAGINDEAVNRMIEVAKQGGNAVEAMDFNLARIENGEQLGELIDEVSTLYAERIYKGKGGVQTFDETQLKADMSAQMGFDVDAVLSRREGEIWPAHKIKAARDIFTAELEKTKAMALAIKEPGGNSEDAYVAFRRQAAVLAGVQMQIKGVQTEAARALSQFRMTAKSPLETRVQIREMIEATGGAENQELFVDAFINAVENGGPDAAAKFAREAHGATTAEMLYEAWINSLLGSPTTHLVNITGNSVAMVQGVAERYAAAGYGALERGAQRLVGREAADSGVTFAEANAYASGMVGATMDAFRAFGKALKSGEQSDRFGKIDYHGKKITSQNVNELPIAKSIAGRLGKDELLQSNGTLANTVDFLGEYYFRLPGRFLMAEDDFFRTMNYRAEVHALAAREADQMRRAGMTTEEIDARTTAILQDPQTQAPAVHIGAVDHMREQTFTQAPPPGGPAQRANQFFQAAKIGNVPAGKIVVPFFNVINNIVKHAMSRVPGVSAIKGTKTYDDLFSGDPARRQMVMGKWATGGSLMGVGAYMTMNGMMTGRLSDNPRVRQQMEQQGKKPFSVVIPTPDGGHRAVQYNRLDPVGMLLGISATTAEVMHYVEDDAERENIAIAATAAILPYLEEKSFLHGVSQFMNAINPQYGGDDALTESASRYLSNLLASGGGAIAGPLAPGTPLQGFLTREVEGNNVRRMSAPDKFRVEKDAWGDDVLVPNGPEYRIWEGAVKKAFSRTMGLSSDLPPRPNIWGEDQVMENGVTSDSMLSPLYSSELKYDVSKLRDANVPDKIKNGYFHGARIGRDMTLQQHAEFVNIAGIDGELERLGMPISMPRRQLAARNGNKTIGLPVDLNDQQYSDFVRIMNAISVPNNAHPERKSMNMRQMMDWLVRQPEYAKLPEDMDANGSKGDVLRAVMRDYKSAATNVFFQDHKDGALLLRQSIQLKIEAQNTGAR